MQDRGARYFYRKAFWKTFGNVGLLTLAVSVLGVCFTAAFWSLARASLVGRPAPRKATCAELTAGGPQDNAHVIVTKFRHDAHKTVGFTAVSAKDGTWALAYVPLVPDANHQPRASDVRIVLKSQRAGNVRELEQLLAHESLQGCLLAPALVLPQSNREPQVLNEDALLSRIDPAIDPHRCWILDMSAQPVALANDSLWLPPLIGTMLFAIVAFLIGRGFDVPRSARGLLIWVGVATLVSGCGWCFVICYPRGTAVWNALAPVAGLFFAQAGAGFVLGPTTRCVWERLKRVAQNKLLEELVGDLAAGGNQTSVQETVSGDLGRLLCERRNRLGRLVVELIGMAVVIVLLSFQLVGNQFPLAGAAVCGFLALAGSWYFLAAAGTVVRCYEHGITWSRFGRERTLYYREIESFTYKATNSYSNGVYNGTTVKMRFNPDRALKQRTIRFAVHFQNSDHGMEDLRDHVSEIVADRMQQDRKTNGQVSWGSLALRQDGLLVNSASRRELIPFDESEVMDFDNKIYVWVRDEKRPIATVSMSEPNFYPGWVLYHRLRDVDRVTSAEEMDAMAV